MTDDGASAPEAGDKSEMSTPEFLALLAMAPASATFAALTWTHALGRQLDDRLIIAIPLLIPLIATVLVWGRVRHDDDGPVLVVIKLAGLFVGSCLLDVLLLLALAPFHGRFCC